MPMPRLTTFADLDRYLVERSDAFSADYQNEDHLTHDARQRALGKVAILSELRVAIAYQVGVETLAAMLDKPERPDDQLPDDHPSWGAGGRRVADAG